MAEGFGFNLETFTSVGMVVFALAYLWNQYRSGATKAQADADKAQVELIQTLTAQLKAQKEISDSLQAQITELTGKIGKLEGINEANDQKIKEYLQIIANRNPELEETLKLLEEAVRALVPFMGDMRQWHQDIRSALNITNPMQDSTLRSRIKA
jgi:peptidoglycan hydrolase CwlO-like protein